MLGVVLHQQNFGFVRILIALNIPVSTRFIELLKNEIYHNYFYYFSLFIRELFTRE